MANKRKSGGGRSRKARGEIDASMRTRKATSERDFLALMRSAHATTSKLAEERGSLGARIADAVEHKHLHKKAFGDVARLARQEPNKLAEYLFCFDLYRGYAKLDELKAAQLELEGEAEQAIDEEIDADPETDAGTDERERAGGGASERWPEGDDGEADHPVKAH